jgi:hypothetical protein
MKFYDRVNELKRVEEFTGERVPGKIAKTG